MATSAMANASGFDPIRARNYLISQGVPEADLDGELLALQSDWESDFPPAGTGTPLNASGRPVLNVQIGGNSQRDLQGTDVNAEAIVDEQQPVRLDANLPQVDLPPAVQDVDPAPAPAVEQVVADPEVGQSIPPDVLLQGLADSTNDPQVKKDLALLQNTHRALGDGSDATQRNAAAMEDLGAAWARMENLVFDRSAWVAAFGTAGYLGGAIGAAAPTFGAGAVPGGIVGGGLGAAFGGQAYDAFVNTFFPGRLSEEEIPDPMAASSTGASSFITDDMSEAPPASPVQPLPPEEQSFSDRLVTAGGDVIDDMSTDVGWSLLFGPGASAAKLALRGKWKKFLGLDSARAEEIVEQAFKADVPIGIVNVTDKESIRSAAIMFSSFPWLSGPIRKSAEKITKGVVEKGQQILADLAPWSTIFEKSKAIRAGGLDKLEKFEERATSLYARYYDMAAALPDPSIVNTREIRKTAGELLAQLKKGGVPLARTTKEQAQRHEWLKELAETPASNTAKRLRLERKLAQPPKTQSSGAGGESIASFTEELTRYPEKITVEMYRGLSQRISTYYKYALTQTDGKHFLKKLKESSERMSEDLDFTNVFGKNQVNAAAEGKAVVAALKAANKYWTTNIDKILRTTKTIVKKDVPADALTQAENFSAIWGKTPMGVRDLRSQIGNPAFKAAAGVHFDKIWNAARKEVRYRQETITRLDPKALEEGLGLTTESGKEFLTEVLKGTKVSVKQLEKFIALARKADDLNLGVEPGQFLIRRLVLTGFSGAAWFTAGNMAVPVTALLALIVRQSGKYLTDPKKLQQMMRLLNPDLTRSAQRQVLVRLLRDNEDLAEVAEGDDVEEKKDESGASSVDGDQDFVFPGSGALTGDAANSWLGN